MRNISLDLIRVTEAAAIAASMHVGSGDKIAADGAATEAMRNRLNKIDFQAFIRNGDGIKYGAPGLFKGEEVGGGLKKHHTYDISVDPIDGTRPTATGGPGAISVMAVSKANTMHCTSDFYMFKLAVGPKARAYFEHPHNHKPILSLSLPQILKGLKTSLGKQVVTVCLLDRPRHHAIIRELRKQEGCRIKLIQDCDITATIAACLPNRGIDM